MASTIKIKRSGVANKTPTTTDIATGELAINYKDQKLFSSNGTAVFQIGASSGGLVSTTTKTFDALKGSDTVITGVTAAVSTNYLQVSNASATYATKAYAAANTYVKSILANTNSYIAAQATRITLVNTNLTGTNTAIRTLVSDRLQVANASTLYATKASPTTSGVLAHTGRATISTNLTVSGNTTVVGSATNRLNVTTSSGQDDDSGLVRVEYTGTSTPINASFTAKNYHGTSQFMQWENYGLRIGTRSSTNGGAGAVIFTVNDSEKTRIDSSVLSLTGLQGIKFQASQSASSDANTLDDYEEGTWTPRIDSNNGSGTFTVKTGYYQKIGKKVTLWFINDSGSSLAAGSTQYMGGLPFNIAGWSDNMVVGSMGTNGPSIRTQQLLTLSANRGVGYIYSGGTQETTTITYASGIMEYFTDN